MWLGAEKAWTWVIVGVFTTGFALLPIQGVNHRLALGGGDIRPTVISHVVLAVVVTLGVLIGTLYLNWQLLAIAIFVTICIVLRSVGFLSAAYSRQFSYSYFLYVYSVYVKPAVLCLVCFLLGVLLRNAVLSLEIRWLFVLTPFVVVLSYIVLSWFILPESIKSMIRTQVTKIISRFRTLSVKN